MKHQQDKNTKLIRTWLQGDVWSNRKTLNTVLCEKGLSAHGITNVLSGHKFNKMRAELVKQFEIK
jgi:hypothetical protein